MRRSGEAARDGSARYRRATVRVRSFGVVPLPAAWRMRSPGRVRMQALHNAGEVMSAQDRATTSELAAEFERAIGSLATKPLTPDDPMGLVVRANAAMKALVYAVQFGAATTTAADQLVRIAAIALEGAARLRRQQ